MSNSKFYDLYNQYRNQLKNDNEILHKLESASRDMSEIYDDDGRPITVQESRFMNLDHHVVKIEQDGATIKITSMLDPKLTGSVSYDNEEDASKTYRSLNTAKNLVYYMRTHYKDETNAYDWSKIMHDERLARQNIKRQEAKAMGAETEDMFNEPDSDGFGGGGGPSGDAPETMGGPGEPSGDEPSGDEPETMGGPDETPE